jgi:hypothetical protein
VNISAGQKMAGTLIPRISPECRDDAKKKIIAATREIAHETEWNTVTLEAVARKVGVTKGAHLYVFLEQCYAHGGGNLRTCQEIQLQHKDR